MQRQNGFAYLFLVIIVAVIATGTLFFYSWQNGLIKVATTQDSPTSPITKQEPDDPFNSWNTYTNKNYEFELKIPPNWSYLETSSGAQIVDPENSYGFMIDVLNSTKVYDQFKNSNTHTTSKVKVGNLETLFRENFSVTGNHFQVNLVAIYNSRTVIVDYLYNDDSRLATVTKVLSTFRFLDDNSAAASPTPQITPPAGWKLQEFSGQTVKIYLPNDWEAKTENFPSIPSSLISMRKNVWDAYPVQLDIKDNWDNTGDAKVKPKNFTLGDEIEAYRADPPKKEVQTLDRYQTNVYFEHEEVVYIFSCVHNWEEDTLNTCNNILKYLNFNE